MNNVSIIASELDSNEVLIEFEHTVHQSTVVHMTREEAHHAAQSILEFLQAEIEEEE